MVGIFSKAGAGIGWTVAKARGADRFETQGAVLMGQEVGETIGYMTAEAAGQLGKALVTLALLVPGMVAVIVIGVGMSLGDPNPGEDPGEAAFRD